VIKAIQLFISDGKINEDVNELLFILELSSNQSIKQLL